MSSWKDRKSGQDKRKKSSDSSEIEKKLCRVGGSPEGSGISCDNISDVLKRSNDVLYNSDELNGSILNESQDKEQAQDPNSSVFDKSEVGESSEEIQSKMAAQQTVSKKPSNSDIMSLLQTMNSKMGDIDKKLERLDILEKKVDNFDSELKKLWTYIHDSHKKLEDKLIRVEDRLDATDLSTGLVSDKITEMEKAAQKAKDELLYVQSQSMRNNLVFSNISEDDRESGEATEAKVRSFLVEKLNIAQETVDQIRFERVHRFGRKTRDSAGRQIVAKFCYYKDREIVRKERGKLKGTNFFINEQFPKDIADKRKKLFPKVAEARRSGKTAWISYDTLYVDGKPIKDASA